MKDFYSFDEYSIPLGVKALFWGLYMVVFVYAVWKTLISVPKDKRHVEVSHLIVLYFAIYAVFYCVNPDYFRYREWLRIPFFVEWGKEQIYIYVILLCRLLPFNYSFEVFRLIVWGGGLWIVLLTAKLYRSLLNPRLTMLFLFTFFCCHYCYARASLAMAVYFMGFSIYLWKRRGSAKLLGIALVVCSYFFHHQMIIGIAALPSLLFPSEKKKSIFFSLILLVIIIGGITYINSNLGLLENIFGNDELADKIEHFNEQEQRVFRMSTFISYLNVFFPFFLITKFFYRLWHLPNAIAGIYRISFALLMLTIAFFIVSGSRSVYTYRVLNITMIPMSIMIAYCYNLGYFKKYQLLIMFLLALLTNSVRLINAI